MDRWAGRKACRQLDEGLGDEDGDRVQVAGVGDKTEALGLQRDRAAPAERVEDRGQVVATGAADLLARLSQHRFVVGGLPGHQALDEAEETLSLRPLGLLRGEELRMGGGVINQLGEEHGAASCERTPRPPEVQRRRVAVADRLLARSLAR